MKKQIGFEQKESVIIVYNIEKFIENTAYAKQIQLQINDVIVGDWDDYPNEFLCHYS